MIIKTLIAATLVVPFFLPSGVADAGLITYGFRNITNNNATNASIGEAQLFVDVSDLGFNVASQSNQVQFLFRNQGPENSTVSEIYFQDGALLGISQVIQTAPVSFSEGAASPPDLPGGSSIDPAFNVTAGFLADADNPAPHKGVNVGQEVGIVFNLIDTLDFQDVINALGLALSSPQSIPDPDQLTLRIGLHVINFDNGGSESFINGPDVNGPVIPPPGPGVVPEPASLAIFGFGALGLGLAQIRRRRIAASTTT